MKYILFVLVCFCLLVAPFIFAEGSGTTIFDQEKRNIADQIISVFENNTPVIQYGYADILHDGRGITAGRAGFTSASGDMLKVIEKYTVAVPGNPLADYVPRLRALAAHEDGSTEGLEGLKEIWREQAKDKALRDIQDEVVNKDSYVPATDHARNLGASLPLTLLNLYDTAVQHGNGNDRDGLPAIIARATASVGGTPHAGIDEAVWLRAFMNIRRSVLLNPSDEETQKEWAESAGRVDTLIEIFQSGNVLLKTPIVIDTWGDIFTIPAK